MNKRFKMTVISWLIFIVSRLLSATWRVRTVRYDRRQEAMKMGPAGGFIFVTWHELGITGVLTHPGEGHYVLTSRSKDGDLVTFVSERIGLHAVRGSSNRGGREARDELLSLLKQGKTAAITVDGPKGPRHVAKGGMVDLSRRAQTSIIPMVCLADRSWILRKTWDQTRIPKPFSKLVIHYGQPVLIGEDEDFEAARLRVENALKDLNLYTQAHIEELWQTAPPR